MRGIVGLGHSVLKVRPLSEVSEQTLSKFHKFGYLYWTLSNVPAGTSVIVPPRPETCPLTARRMLASALGVPVRSLYRDEETMRAEREQLAAVRERKRNAQREKEAIWMGVTTSKDAHKTDS